MSEMIVDALVLPPDLVALAAFDRQRFPFLLQSSAQEGWDILFALPQEQRRYLSGQGAQMRADLAAIAVRPALLSTDPQELPFRGGWFSYWGYEWLEALEPTVAARTDDDFPIGLLARIPAAILVWRNRGLAWLVAETSAQADELRGLLAACPPYSPKPVKLMRLTEDPAAAFTTGVQRCKSYIREGDVFQVNLSRGWDASLADATDALEVYAQLRKANPAPFSAYVSLGGGHHIISSSPERLVKIDARGRAETRPIAGTHPRSADPVEDAAQKVRMMASTKERAEHVMLIDLERNDLGRIAQPGTVKVDALMEVASYSFVHHIESTVSCQLRAGLNVADIARALFPGGTITGCPKVRTMQIIRELEDRPRRAYTGSLGYINHDGTLDTNILIRTFMQTDNQLYFRAGAGIVADSDPQRELAETEAKVRGLLRALGVEG